MADSSTTSRQMYLELISAQCTRSLSISQVYLLTRPRFFHIAWSSPIGLIICLVLLLVNLGPSALAGFAIFFIGSPIQTWVMKRLFTVRKKAMEWTDKRAKLLQELLGGMRVIKFFTWEVCISYSSSLLQILTRVSFHSLKESESTEGVNWHTLGLYYSSAQVITLSRFLCQLSPPWSLSSPIAQRVMILMQPLSSPH
jgi:ABC transporter transmembrane region